MAESGTRSMSGLAAGSTGGEIANGKAAAAQGSGAAASAATPAFTTPVAMEVPIFTRDAAAACDALGGPLRLAQIIRDRPPTVQFRLRPRDAFSHPVTGDCTSGAAFLLRVRTRRRPVAASHGDVVAAGGGAGGSDGEISATVVATLPVCYRFNSLADMQWLPSGVPLRATPTMAQRVLRLFDRESELAAQPAAELDPPPPTPAGARGPPSANDLAAAVSTAAMESSAAAAGHGPIMASLLRDLDTLTRRRLASFGARVVVPSRWLPPAESEGVRWLLEAPLPAESGVVTDDPAPRSTGGGAALEMLARRPLFPPPHFLRRELPWQYAYVSTEEARLNAGATAPPAGDAGRSPAASVAAVDDMLPSFGVALGQKAPVPVSNAGARAHDAIVRTLRRALESRHIWTRAALQTIVETEFAGPVRTWLGALAGVAYRGRGGCFSQTYLLMGVDPRSHPAYRLFQCVDARPRPLVMSGLRHVPDAIAMIGSEISEVSIVGRKRRRAGATMRQAGGRRKLDSDDDAGAGEAGGESSVDSDSDADDAPASGARPRLVTTRRAPLQRRGEVGGATEGDATAGGGGPGSSGSGTSDGSASVVDDDDDGSDEDASVSGSDGVYDSEDVMGVVRAGSGRGRGRGRGRGGRRVGPGRSKQSLTPATMAAARLGGLLDADEHPVLWLGGSPMAGRIRIVLLDMLAFGLRDLMLDATAVPTLRPLLDDGIASGAAAARLAAATAIAAFARVVDDARRTEAAPTASGMVAVGAAPPPTDTRSHLVSGELPGLGQRPPAAGIAAAAAEASDGAASVGSAVDDALQPGPIVWGPYGAVAVSAAEVDEVAALLPPVRTAAEFSIASGWLTKAQVLWLRELLQLQCLWWIAPHVPASEQAAAAREMLATQRKAAMLASIARSQGHLQRRRGPAAGSTRGTSRKRGAARADVNVLQADAPAGVRESSEIDDL